MAARSLLAASLLILTLTLTLGASRSASQEQGFQSINCGGEAYIDPNTMLVWDADNNDVDNNGRVGKVDSNLENVTNVMTTLRYFPNDWRNRKFCYSLLVNNGSTYLLRASFLYGNYDTLNQPPTFVLIFNFDEWTNVTTSSSATPIMHEITFVSKEHDLNICLAPHFNSNDTPFISTLELRDLDTMYLTHNFSSALSLGHGLMLWHRINYGARSEVAIRFPDDQFDRIWEANTSGPIVSTSTDKAGTNYGVDAEKPPAEVMATAITSNNSKGNLSFTYEGLGGSGGLRIELHFEEVDETLSAGQRNFSFALANLVIQPGISPAFGEFQNQSGISPVFSPLGLFVDGIAEFPSPLQFTLIPAAGSPRGPLLNAIELFRWTPQPLSTIATFQGDVDTIKQIQTYFKLVGYGQGDPCMPKGYTWSWISCNQDIPQRIIEIKLASFNLTGDIPQIITNLTSLQKIDLSNNMLSGDIPDLNPLLDLESLDLHNNILSGELPPSLYTLPKLTNVDVRYNKLCVISLSSQALKNFSFVGNDETCNCLDPSLLEKANNKARNYILATSFLGGLYIVSILTLVIYKLWRRKEKQETSNDKKGGDDPKSLPFVTRIFTYNEIRNATLNFTTLLGEGGFGKVYHGILPTTGEAIAVKMLVDASKQGLKEFYNEVAILSRVRHKNLVSLSGYCVENTYMLIYEYIAKGNLRNLLYGETESVDKPLPWTTRLHIALDASHGLEYLHIGCDHAIIHRDVKSSNILLTHKMQAKVADFGLSRLKEGDNGISHVSTINVAGTIGYLDPAYYATNQLTDTSDVYSFGIVLFELICGRAPIDMFTSLPHIVDWVTPAILQDKFEHIVDPLLESGYKEESMRKVVDVAFACVNHDRTKRPKMRQVSQLLQNALEVELEQDYSAHSKDVISDSSSTKTLELSPLQDIETMSTNLDPC